MTSSSFAKGLYSAPEGLEALGEDESPLEIEIMNPEMVTLDDGSVEITLIPEDEESEGGFDENLADILDEGAVQEIANELLGLIDADITSRKEWADTFVKGLEVLGFRYEERTEPWDDACGVYSTVLAEAAIRFQAETINNKTHHWFRISIIRVRVLRFFINLPFEITQHPLPR